MSATAKRQVVLQRLLDQGSLAASACSRAFVRFVSPLISGSVLAWEKSGAGRRLAVRNPAPLAEFLSRHFRKMRARLEISRRVRKGPPASEIRNGLAARGKTSFAYAVGTMEHCFIEVKRCPSSERRLTLVYSPFCCVLTRCTNSAVASPL